MSALVKRKKNRNRLSDLQDGKDGDSRAQFPCCNFPSCCHSVHFQIIYFFTPPFIPAEFSWTQKLHTLYSLMLSLTYFQVASRWLPSGLQGWPCPVYPEKFAQVNMCHNIFLFYTIELVWICNYLLECFLVNLLFPSLNSKFHEPKNRISLFDKPPYLYPAHTSGKE